MNIFKSSIVLFAIIASAMIMPTNSSSVATVGTLTLAANSEYIPTSYNFITGFMCPNILNDYGTTCFDEATQYVLDQLIVGLGSDAYGLPNRTAIASGLPGKCFSAQNYLVMKGLSPSAQILATQWYTSRMNYCTLYEFTPRVFMAALWSGIGLICIVLIVAGIVITAVPSLSVYFLTIGRAVKS